MNLIAPDIVGRTQTISAQMILRAIWLASLVVVSLGVFREFLVNLGIISDDRLRTLYLDGEANFPAWYSSSLMIICALLMALIGWHRLSSKSVNGWHWVGLSAIFIYLSLDEAISLHENLVVPMRETFKLTGVLYFGWIVAALPLVAAFCLVYLRFLYLEDRKTAIRLVLAGMCYVFGAIGAEMLGGYIRSGGYPDWAYSLSFILEESLEILGITLLFRLLIIHMSQANPSYRVSS